MNKSQSLAFVLLEQITEASNFAESVSRTSNLIFGTFILNIPLIISIDGLYTLISKGFFSDKVL